jgi:hypothetical protein
VGPALRHSCRSELHVLPRFPVAQTIRSPDYDELSSPHRCFQSGPACYGFVCHPGISPLSRYGIQLALVLPSVLPVMSLQTSCGLHRFEPVRWNGVATALGNVTYPTRNFATLGPFICYEPACSLHVVRETTRLRTRLPPAYRYAARTVSSTRRISGAWRAVSEDSLTSNNSMIESSEYLRLIAPPSFISRRIARISSMPSLDRWRPS